MVELEHARATLNDMGLTVSSNLLDAQIERSTNAHHTYVQFLNELLVSEKQERDRRNLEFRIRRAHLPYVRRIEEYDFAFQPSIDKRLVDELSTTAFAQRAENVVLLGPPGVGKTHLAIALGILAIEHSFSTYFINCHQLIQNLLKASHENRLDEKLKIYARYKVLIIDEIGYLPTNLEGANLFFQLIAKRYEKHSTIFTTNKNFGEWADVFRDNMISAAILDRILHHSTTIKIVGDSYRLKEYKTENNDD